MAGITSRRPMECSSHLCGGANRFTANFRIIDGRPQLELCVHGFPEDKFPEAVRMLREELSRFIRQNDGSLAPV